MSCVVCKGVVWFVTDGKVCKVGWFVRGVCGT